MAKKRKIIVFCIIGASVLLLLIISGILLTKKDSSLLYGTFTLVNKDGSIGSITLTDTTVYCDNIDYLSSEWEAARSMAQDYYGEKRFTMEEYRELLDQYVEALNFEDIFDKTECPISNTQYSEESNQYDYTVPNPRDGSYGLLISYDVASKTLELAGLKFSLSESQ